MKNELDIYDNLAPLVHKSKKEIKEVVNRQVEYVKETGNAENTWAALRKVKEVVDGTMDGIKDDAMTAITRGSNSFHGVSMKIQGRTTYDFKNDKEWVRLNQLLKDRETLLKGLKEPIEVVDETTGEVTTLYPPIKKVSDYILGVF